MSLDRDAVGAIAIGSRDDWMSNVLGQDLFGTKLNSFVSLIDGVSKPIVRLPPVPADVGARGLARVFGVASGAALRNAYTTFDRAGSSSGGSENSGSISLGTREYLTDVVVEPVDVATEAFRIAGPAGELLSSMNDMVLARSGMLSGSQIASGCCYEVIFKPKHRQEALVNLKRWPSLRSLLEVPFSWFADSDVLQRVGVSVRGGNLHFQMGWGDGVLTALDVVTVGLRSRVNSTVGLNELLDLKVGGGYGKPKRTYANSSDEEVANEGQIDPSSDKLDNQALLEVSPEFGGRDHIDCRKSLLRKLGIVRLAVWGKDMPELRASPGWNVLVEHLGDDYDSAMEMICPHGKDHVCECWQEIPKLDALVACYACGFMVNESTHSERCLSRDAKVSRDRYDVKKKAWIGDAEHQLDVRKILLEYMTYASAVLELNRYTSAAGQYRFLHEFRKISMDTAAASDYFEANYDEFRAEYEKWLRADLNKGFGADFYSGAVKISDWQPAGSEKSGSTREKGSPDLPPMDLGAGIGKLDELAVILSDDNKAGFLIFVREKCTLKDFTLFEQVLERTGISCEDRGVYTACKPSKPGPLEVDKFKPLVRQWFASGVSVSEGLAKFVYGRSVACVAKKEAMRCIAEVANNRNLVVDSMAKQMIEIANRDAKRK